MSLPTLTPQSTLSAVILPITGAAASVNSAVPYKIYSAESGPLYSSQFISGAVDQVSFVYKKLGGDILDIELTEGNVYAAYEEAVLEYSYLVNLHQATNILGDSLGNSTGSFDHKGNLMSGELSSSLDGGHVALRYPKFDYGMSRNISEGVSADISLAHSVQYSASFDVSEGVQDYDLQEIINSRINTSATGSLTFSDSPGNNDTFTLTDTDGNSVTFKFNVNDNTTTANTTPAVLGIQAIVAGDVQNTRAVATTQEAASTINANTTINITATIDGSDNKKIILTQDKGGAAGDRTIVETSGKISKVDFTGGADEFPYAGKINGKRILIKKVFYKTPHAMWRFFGYYGGLNVVGNLHNYGQFSDDSTFQLIPAWHNKAQAMAFEDAIYTRMSHFSYELRDNKIRLHPIPQHSGPRKMWIEFSVPEDSWSRTDSKTKGVNNMNTLPIGNLPFISINSIGKQWIRRFALALCKEMLGQVRSKFGSVPIPGDNITLNGTALITEGKDEQEKLREELKTTLAELTYQKVAEQESAMMETAGKTMEKVPNYIFVG